MPTAIEQNDHERPMTAGSSRGANPNRKTILSIKVILIFELMPQELQFF